MSKLRPSRGRALPASELQAERLVGRTLRDGKLLVEAFVGSGRTGAVYRARHRELGKTIAVKVLHSSLRSDDGFCARFQANARAACRLDHQNLTRVHDFGVEPDGLLYLSMEFLDGADLRTVLQERGALGEARAIQILLQVCAGLAHAHARGIVHGDVRPETLVVLAATDDDEREVEHVKVCDFALARAAGIDADSRAVGTADYMSPEQRRGAEIDPRSDVYACGVVLYELVTGRVPFAGELALDPRLEGVILTALAKEPSRRQQSMRELRAQLGSLLAPLEPLGPPSQPLACSPVLASNEPPAAPVQDWFEDRRSVYATFMAAPEVVGADVRVLEPRSDERGTARRAGDERPRSPAVIVAELVAATDPRAFAALLAGLEHVVRDLAEQRDTTTLWRLASTVDGIAGEARPLRGTRASVAATFSQRFSDPALLASIATEALVGRLDPSGSARKMLVRAGAAGARAAYTARVRDQRPETRAAFVAVLGEIGPHALPTIRAGLERLEPRLNAAGAADVARDLLEALPASRDEALAELVARFTRADEPALASAATRALARVRGPRPRGGSGER